MCIFTKAMALLRITKRNYSDSIGHEELQREITPIVLAPSSYTEADRGHFTIRTWTGLGT